MPDLGIFGLEFESNICQIWNQHPQIRLTAKFCEKAKIPKLGPEMPYLGIFGI